MESTVIGWEDGEPRLLRAGGASVEAIERALGKSLAKPMAKATDEGKAQASPGALPWHYAPRTPLRLLADAGAHETLVKATSGLLWFGSDAPSEFTEGITEGFTEGFARTENLSAQGDLTEAAANLFAALHRLDEAGLDVIYATLVPDTGLGRAVNDRLRKAAAAPR